LYVGELFGEFTMADSIDAGFERRDAEETPLGIGDALDESFFVVGIDGGLVLAEVAVEVLLIEGGVIIGEQNRTAGKTGFDSVEGGFGFACGGFGSGGQGGIGTVGGDAGRRDGLRVGESCSSGGDEDGWRGC
jgi:hypothetical protein